MVCNSNADADIGSWLSSQNSPLQTIRAHMEKELLWMISHKRRLVAKIALHLCLEIRKMSLNIWKDVPSLTIFSNSLFSSMANCKY